MPDKDIQDIEILIKSMQDSEILELIKLGDEKAKNFLGILYKDNWFYIRRGYLWKWS